jgi:flavin-dependent dehydrogenase
VGASVSKDVAEDYDVIVVGGGPAGTSASVHLALRGGAVALVERERFPRAKLCGEFISPECLAHFARLGVLAEMRAAGAAGVGETIFFARSGRRVSVPSAWFGGEATGGGEACALGLSRAEMDHRLMQRRGRGRGGLGRDAGGGVCCSRTKGGAWAACAANAEAWRRNCARA